MAVTAIHQINMQRDATLIGKCLEKLRDRRRHCQEAALD